MTPQHTFKIKTKPYMVVTKRHSLITHIWKYDHELNNFVIESIDSEHSVYYFWACRDQYNNVILFNTYKVYCMFKQDAKDYPFYDIFTICRDCQEHELIEIKSTHKKLLVFP